MSGRRLPVRACRVVSAGDVIETHHTVQCPRRQESTAFARCCGCPQMLSIDVEENGKSGTVNCSGVEGKLPNGRVDVAEAAVRIRLGEILGNETTCVRSDVDVDVVADLLVEHRLRAVPVVDGTRRLVGIVSKTDLLRRSAGKTVADIMTPLVHGLPEDAPVAYAISLMAFEGLHEVPIVDSKSHVIGMITSTEVLKWVAQSLGYVVAGKVNAET